jgi:hypothetical protein
MTTARPASAARHGPSLAALTQPTTAATPRIADLHLLLTYRPEGSGGYFSVRLEGGQSSLLVSDDPAEADSGEVFNRFPGGRHVVSVEADGLSWTITFTHL